MPRAGWRAAEPPKRSQTVARRIRWYAPAPMRLELTRRGDYAVRTMLVLAAQDPTAAPLSARRVAAAMSIPERFLPHVLRDLVRAGLVEGHAGRTGGYRLSRPPRAITLLDVIEAAEGDGKPPTCVLRGGPCHPDGRCAVHDVFAGARSLLLEQLRTTTLADVPLPHVFATP
jgi:Rrf2 family protein